MTIPAGGNVLDRLVKVQDRVDLKRVTLWISASKLGHVDFGKLYEF